jgi:nucleoside-diphosphate-sugar epimerase
VVAAGTSGSDPDLWWYASAGDVARAFRLALEVADAKDRTFFIGAPNTCSPIPTLELVARRYGGVPPLRKAHWYRDDAHAALFDTTLARDVLGFRTRDDWRNWTALSNGAK